MAKSSVFVVSVITGGTVLCSLELRIPSPPTTPSSPLDNTRLSLMIGPPATALPDAAAMPPALLPLPLPLPAAAFGSGVELNGSSANAVPAANTIVATIVHCAYLMHGPPGEWFRHLLRE